MLENILLNIIVDHSLIVFIFIHSILSPTKINKDDDLVLQKDGPLCNEGHFQ